MRSEAVVGGVFSAGVPGARRRAEGTPLALVCLALVAAVSWASVGIGESGGPPLRPAHEDAGAPGLGALPMQAQSVISTALGSGQAPFAAKALGNGYQLDGGGVSAVVGSRETFVGSAAGTLSVSLSGVGRGTQLNPVGRDALAARGNGVSRSYPGLRESYAAGPLGIEQTFTVMRRPTGARGPLTVALHLGGSLRVALVGSEVRFSAGTGRVALRYGGLAVRDSRGRRLAATFAVAGRSLSLSVDDRGAVYPIRIDPFIQQGEKLTGGGASGRAAFGESVAVSADGNTALVGGPENEGGVGAAWVFTRTRGTWSQQGEKLTGGGESGEAHFGRSVALSADGNTALVGGPADRGAGAAWVFTRTGGAWTQQGKKLVGDCESDCTGSEGTGENGGGNLGSSVALSADGNTALVAAVADDQVVGAVWVFIRSEGAWTQQGEKLVGNCTSHCGGNEGTGERYAGEFGRQVALSADGSTALIGSSENMAWVFTRSGATWNQQGPALTGGSETGGREFGWSVALSANGNTALIGGPKADNDAGAAWVFTRSVGTWTQQGEKLTGGGETGSGEFGLSVALSYEGNIALIGAPGDGGGTGAVWVFAFANGTWSQQGQKIVGDCTSGCSGSAGTGERGAGRFGSSVALSSEGNTALLGARADYAETGAAWIFTSSESTWSQQGEKLTGAGESGGANFGHSVALSADGNTALVGGWGDDGENGAAWVFTRSAGIWTQQGEKLVGDCTSGCSGSEGTGEKGEGRLGASVALSADGNTALLGAPEDNKRIGAAWLFTRSGGTWSQQGEKLTGDDESRAGEFGASVAISADGNTALIGAPYDELGDGAVSVFTRSEGTWSQSGGKLVGDRCGMPASCPYNLGASVSLSSDGDTALIGSPYENGHAGAAWVFTRSANGWSHDPKHSSRTARAAAPAVMEQGRRGQDVSAKAWRSRPTATPHLSALPRMTNTWGRHGCSRGRTARGLSRVTSSRAAANTDVSASSVGVSRCPPTATQRSLAHRAKTWVRARHGHSHARVRLGRSTAQSSLATVRSAARVPREQARLAKACLELGWRCRPMATRRSSGRLITTGAPARPGCL